MVKKLNIPVSNKNQRISIRIPLKLNDEINNFLTSHNIPSRNRSEWIVKAIHKLKEVPQYWIQVQEDWIERGQNVNIQVSLDKATKKLLSDMSKEVSMKLNEDSTDLNSNIIRTAIIRRLIEEGEVF